MEQMYLRDDRQRRRPDQRDRRRDSNREGDRDAEHDKDAEQGKEQEIKQEVDEETNKEREGDAEPKPDQEVEQKKGPATDSEKTILDYKEGDEITERAPEMIPAYSTERGVGASFLTEFKCVQCTLCRKLLDSEETAEVHLRTWRHHQLFVRLLHEKTPGQSDDVVKIAETSKRPLDSEESGNWKRRKTEPRDEDADDQDDKDLEVTVKVEASDTASEGRANGNNDVEASVPLADELEDWEQSVDEILNDEADTTIANAAPEKPEPEKEKSVVEEPPQEIAESTPVKVNKPKTSPRGRGRGRPRRY